jgi:hypothetical protein
MGFTVIHDVEVSLDDEPYLASAHTFIVFDDSIVHDTLLISIGTSGSASHEAVTHQHIPNLIWLK